jgi:hypothetical protein
LSHVSEKDLAPGVPPDISLKWVRWKAKLLYLRWNEKTGAKSGLDHEHSRYHPLSPSLSR